jgi:hypothetical protein
LESIEEEDIARITNSILNSENGKRHNEIIINDNI